MPGRKAKKPVSKAQARLFGVIASGGSVKGVNISAQDAKKKLHGLNEKKLPERVKKKKS